MTLCQRGLPIDSARIAKHEKLIHFLIHSNFSNLVFPSYFAYEDVANLCRYEVFKAIQKVDPKKALDSYLEDPKKRAKKIAEKLADPEKAYAQAEQNLSYWAIDNFLGRLKWNYGTTTASENKRGIHVSLETLVNNHLEPFLAGKQFEMPLVTRPVDEHNATALMATLKWLLRWRGPEKAKAFLDKVEPKCREIILEQIKEEAEARAVTRVTFYQTARYSNEEQEQDQVFVG